MSNILRKTVFISYSHRDEEWKDRLTSHLSGVLGKSSYELFDDRRIRAGDDWYAEFEKAIDSAAVAILLISADYLSSEFISKDEVPRLLARREAGGLHVLPLIIRPCAWKLVRWLAELQVWPKDARPLAGKAGDRIDSDLAEMVEVAYQFLDRPLAAPATRGDGPREVTAARADGPKVSIGRLPVTGPELYGRRRELYLLDECWDGNVNVVSVSGWGGVGKSALVNAWLRRMSADDYRGAERVYGWSFYNQGSADAAASADAFIENASAWFGDPDPRLGSPWEKGERLAHLVGSRRTLLVLDGLERLQVVEGPAAGRLQDATLLALLHRLAAFNEGLCVITTRSRVADLADFDDFSARQIDLEELSPAAGAELLRSQGARGSSEELERAAAEFGGHALALTLLGSFLASAYEGEILSRDYVPRFFEESRRADPTHAVLTAYERYLGEGPELELLSILGLLNRPLDKSSLQALTAPPVISGLTERLQGVGGKKFNAVLARLRRARLISEPDRFMPDALDTHPLVRMHFGDRLRERYPEAWREGHGRLYEHLGLIAREYPVTVAEMAPLYYAVTHGCQAGREQEALVAVYWRRIQRRNEFYNTRFLGAYGADLAVLSNFFDEPWTRPSARLDEQWQAVVLNVAGFDLLALGRLPEALGPTRVGLDASVRTGDWVNAAIASVNLGELHQTLGELEAAISYARTSAALAERVGNLPGRITSLAALGDARHQSGLLEDAQTAFVEAERIQREVEPEAPFLYSRLGFKYCDLLLTLGGYQQVRARAARMMEVSQPHPAIFDIALSKLLLGRVATLQIRSGEADDYATALGILDDAVQGLRQAGRLDYLPLGLLARAEALRVAGEFERARADIDEATAVATRGSMALLRADCLLTRAGLSAAAGDMAEARAALAVAKEMVERMGYRRRDADIRRVEAAL
jgi:tetratricopeptide (TPR) repeat protein